METTVESGLDSVIPMRGLQDAMDCSLALTSQAIVNEIGQPESARERYELYVADADYPSALKTVELFREENRRWKWTDPLHSAGLSFRWSSLVWCLVLGAFGYLPSIRPGVEVGGILDSALVFDGEWWRILTATMLHRDVAHLFSNLSAGLFLFGLAMGRFGVGIGLLAIVLTGVGGNLFGLAFHTEPYRGLGASGAVMGALGLLGPHAIGLIRVNRHAWRLVIGGLLGVVMLFVLFGLSPQSDVLAHMGGFVTGVAMGAILGLRPEHSLKRGVPNLLASVVLLALLLGSWFLALRG